MGKLSERENILINNLKIRKKLSTSEAVQLLDISESSVRRLFTYLEKNNKISRVYGGIKLAYSNLDFSYSFEDFESKNVVSKQAIASFAISLISSNDIIYLDCGTTIAQLAITIKTKIITSKLKNIYVITNSIPNLNILNDVCDVTLIGGKYRPWRKDFSGSASEKFVRHFNFKKIFLGADGFDSDQGFTAKDTDTARLSELVISRSQKKYVLMDSSKIGTLSFVSFAPASAIDMVITDSFLTSQQELYCKNACLSLSIAK